MKRLYIASLMLLLNAFVVQAQHFPTVPGLSALEINFPPGTAQYSVIINGARYSVQHRTFSLGQIPSGTIALQIGYWSGIGQQAQFISVYSGHLHLQAQMRTIATLSQRGQLRISRQEPILPPFQPVVPGYIPPMVQPWHPHQSGIPGHGYGWAAPMATQQFNLLLSSIRNRSFDNDKVLVAQQAIRFQGLSAQQIRFIMEELSFESNRLRFAKFAFDFCVDPQNYFLVNDAFRFSGSVRSLEQHIFSGR
jgi:hypothetical protein